MRIPISRQITTQLPINLRFSCTRARLIIFSFSRGQITRRAHFFSMNFCSMSVRCDTEGRVCVMCVCIVNIELSIQLCESRALVSYTTTRNVQLLTHVLPVCTYVRTDLSRRSWLGCIYKGMCTYVRMSMLTWADPDWILIIPWIFIAVFTVTKLKCFRAAANYLRMDPAVIAFHIPGFFLPKK